MSVTFVNLPGLPIRIARNRSIIPSSANDLTLVSAKVNSKAHRTKHLPAEMMHHSAKEALHDSSLNYKKPYVSYFLCSVELPIPQEADIQVEIPSFGNTHLFRTNQKNSPPRIKSAVSICIPFQITVAAIITLKLKSFYNRKTKIIVLEHCVKEESANSDGFRYGFRGDRRLWAILRGTN